jgi:hypothetical protein
MTALLMRERAADWVWKAIGPVVKDEIATSRTTEHHRAYDEDSDGAVYVVLSRLKR